MEKVIKVGTPEWKRGMIALADSLVAAVEQARTLAHGIRHHGPDGVDPQELGGSSCGLPDDDSDMSFGLAAEAAGLAEEINQKLEALRPALLAAAVRALMNGEHWPGYGR
jgi:hypothetical protein